MPPLPKTSAAARSSIVVTGDVVLDEYLYEGDRYDPGDASKRDVRRIIEPGGMWCVHRLLSALFDDYADELARQRIDAQHDGDIACLTAKYWQSAGRRVPDPAPREIAAAFEELWNVRAVGSAADAAGLTSYGTWRPTAIDRRTDIKTAKPADIVWRSHSAMGYGGTAPPAFVPMESEMAPRILVMDDADLTFRRGPEGAWLLPALPSGPEFVVLKTVAPVGRGPLWEYLSRAAPQGESWLDRTVLICSADSLRRDLVGVNRGLSWERTAEDLRHALFTSPAVTQLTRCRHLVVVFGAEGALWVSRDGRGSEPAFEASLMFDAGRSEGEWRESIDGRAAGYLTCVTTSIVRALAQHLGGPSSRLDLRRSIQAGLETVRDLDRLGHGSLGDKDLPSGFPTSRLAAAIRAGGGSFQSSPVPWSPPPASDRGTWSIVEMSQRSLLSDSARGLTGLARQVVLHGQRAIESLPHARFGRFVTADRREIETLRHIRRLMWNYRNAKESSKPLSIGVFGPPGAGKSFAVKQVAEAVFGSSAWMEFNLSQFANPDDFIGALHQVRDRVLEGLTPVVFWDEFDAQEFLWLRYLLAPMQDGRFQSGQITHPVGKSVFVFAGGTSRTYEAFGTKRTEPDAQTVFELRKGPDFHSRLDGYYDVLGPNCRRMTPAGQRPSDGDPRDETDVAWPLRRAIFITSHLPPRKDQPLDIDPGLINALLEVPDYVHGARSLEKILLSLKPTAGDAPIRRSALPPPAVLSMHVAPVGEFDKLMHYEEEVITSLNIDIIAAAIHDNYLQLVNQRPPDPAFGTAFAELDEPAKEANRTAARRIPEVLALAGLTVEEGTMTPAERQQIDEHLAHHRELLAEAEHVGWKTERQKAGWRYGTPRDNQRRIHPLLVPFDALPELEKQKDRDAVSNYAEVLAQAGYRIVFKKN